MCCVGTVQDEVKSKGVVLVPILIRGNDEVLGSHLESIFLLARAVRQDVDFCTEGDSE